MFGEVLYDVADSMRRHGIENILVVNGHAGNSGPVQQRLNGYREKLGINIEYHSYWEAYSSELVKEQMESGVCPGHAAEFETAFALAAFPDNVDWNGVDYDSVLNSPFQMKDKRRSDREYHHQAKLATTEKGQVMIDVAVQWVCWKNGTDDHIKDNSIGRVERSGIKILTGDRIATTNTCRVSLRSTRPTEEELTKLMSFKCFS